MFRYDQLLSTRRLLRRGSTQDSVLVSIRLASFDTPAPSSLGCSGQRLRRGSTQDSVLVSIRLASFDTPAPTSLGCSGHRLRRGLLRNRDGMVRGSWSDAQLLRRGATQEPEWVGPWKWPEAQLPGRRATHESGWNGHRGGAGCPTSSSWRLFGRDRVNESSCMLLAAVARSRRSSSRYRHEVLRYDRLLRRGSTQEPDRGVSRCWMDAVLLRRGSTQESRWNGPWLVSGGADPWSRGC